jgi:hypothetical protein
MIFFLKQFFMQENFWGKSFLSVCNRCHYKENPWNWCAGWCCALIFAIFTCWRACPLDDFKRDDVNRRAIVFLCWWKFSNLIFDAAIKEALVRSSTNRTSRQTVRGFYAAEEFLWNEHELKIKFSGEFRKLNIFLPNARCIRAKNFF